MKYIAIAATFATLLSGCATEVSAPVSGEIGRERAQGQYTARLSGEGSYFVLTSRGLRCDGTYDSLTTQPTITSQTACNDGRTGTLILTRSPRGGSGTAIGRLNDGTEARFVFGDLTFNQAFGDGGGASTR